MCGFPARVLLIVLLTRWFPGVTPTSASYRGIGRAVWSIGVKFLPDYAHIWGGKREIWRSFGPDHSDTGDPKTLERYGQLHREVEAEIQQAEVKASVAIKVNENRSPIAPGGLETFPLSKRDIAGIAGDTWNHLLNVSSIQGVISEERQIALVKLLMLLKGGSDQPISTTELAMVTEPTLKSLSIAPSPEDMEKIGEQLLKYIPIYGRDVGKLREGDYSPPELSKVAPPPPKRLVSWEDLFRCWRISVGGVMEEDGYGISTQRDRHYLTVIEEIQKALGKITPTEVTPPIARTYIEYLHTQTNLSVRTKQKRISLLLTLYRQGIREGLITNNPFSSLQITTPVELVESSGYSSLDEEQLILIFSEIARAEAIHRRLVPWICLTTGCRMAEALQLRTWDIKQTDTGIWYFDWKYQAVCDYPMMLKTHSKGNKMIPMHPALIRQGILGIDRSERGRLFPQANQSSSSWSRWFGRLTDRIGIYEKRKYTFHSLRNTFKTMCREAGVPEDIRSAIQGHTPSSLGEKSYGKPLAQLPDVLYEQVIKLNFDFIDVSYQTKE